MVFWTASGSALSLVLVAPVGVRSRSTVPAALGISVFTRRPSAATTTFGVLPSGCVNFTSKRSTPLSVVFETLAIWPSGDWARTVFWTVGGSLLKSEEAFSMLWLQPTSKPVIAVNVIAYFFMVQSTRDNPCQK